jgi:hypothetical protein
MNGASVKPHPSRIGKDFFLRLWQRDVTVRYQDS